MGPHTFASKNIIGQKKSSVKIWSKKLVGKKKFSQENFWIKSNFGSEKNSGQTKILGKKNVVKIVLEGGQIDVLNKHFSNKIKIRG